MSHLKEGEKAPDFTAQDQNGNTINLHDLKGQKVVLYFYPKDDTPGCTAEACNLRDNFQELRSQGYTVLGVSPDNVKSHEKFAGKYSLPFSLLADPDKVIAKEYGAWGKKSMYGKLFDGLLRTTFLINENGDIDKIIRKVDTKEHTKQILK
jgi:peroxiredoxin Q/BCP